MKKIYVINFYHLKQTIKEEIEKYGNNCDLNHIKFFNIDSLNYLFKDSKFNGDISKWDVSTVKSMVGMFEYSDFNGDISQWDLSNVENLGYMFCGSKFNQDISNLNISNIRNFSHMFQSSNFNHDLTSWDISNATRIEDMFYDCPAPKPWWYIENNELRKEIFSKKKLQDELINSIISKKSIKSTKL